MAEQNGLNGALHTVPEFTNGIPRSDSACTFQSYDASSRSSNVAKSSSVNPRLIDLAEETPASSTAALTEMSSSDEFSSLSGYESIGTEEEIQGKTWLNFILSPWSIYLPTMICNVDCCFRWK